MFGWIKERVSRKESDSIELPVVTLGDLGFGGETLVERMLEKGYDFEWVNKDELNVVSTTYQLEVNLKSKQYKAISFKSDKEQNLFTARVSKFIVYNDKETLLFFRGLNLTCDLKLLKTYLSRKETINEKVDSSVSFNENNDLRKMEPIINSGLLNAKLGEFDFEIKEVISSALARGFNKVEKSKIINGIHLSKEDIILAVDYNKGVLMLASKTRGNIPIAVANAKQLVVHDKSGFKRFLENIGLLNNTPQENNEANFRKSKAFGA